MTVCFVACTAERPPHGACRSSMQRGHSAPFLSRWDSMWCCTRICSTSRRGAPPCLCPPRHLPSEAAPAFAALRCQPGPHACKALHGGDEQPSSNSKAPLAARRPALLEATRGGGAGRPLDRDCAHVVSQVDPKRQAFGAGHQIVDIEVAWGPGRWQYRAARCVP